MSAEGDEISGSLCEKGILYAKEEMTNPTRNIATSVRVTGGTLSMLSVKTAAPIPKGKIFEVTHAVHQITACAPVQVGDIILKNAADTNIDMVATRHVPRRGYIFDLDGTLLDSAGVWNKINRGFFVKRGIDFPENYQHSIAAMPFEQVAIYTKERFSLPESPAELMQEFLADSIDAYSHEVALKPGAKAYLTRLYKTGHKLAVATAAPRALLTPALKNHGIYELFDAIITTQDAGFGKTRPDVFIMAAQKINHAPTECIVFDDILPAIISAKSADFITCGVRDDQPPQDWNEIKRIAHYTINNFKGIGF
jgi:HAD superfamily hydrolase (TIGR01509 family)